MKLLLITSILVITLANTTSANPYKEDKSVGHSLYREKDDNDRMSGYAQSIPPPVEEYYLIT